MHEVYHCFYCNKPHSTSTDAQECCLPDLYFVCDVCGKEDFDEDVIRECEEGHT
jgi:hypothetical protein